MNDYKNRLVSEVMRREVRTIAPGGLLGEAARTMCDTDITCLVVDLGDPARGFGIITQKDVIGLVFDGLAELDTTTVGEVMSHPTVTLVPEWNLETAVALMRMMGVRRAPVVEAGKLVGFLSFTDVFSAAVRAVTTAR